jgi:hypothetical protein
MLLRAFYPGLSKLAVRGMSIAGHCSVTAKKQSSNAVFFGRGFGSS